MCTCNRTSTKCIKMKKAHAKRAEQLFFTFKYLNLASLRNDDGNGNHYRCDWLNEKQ